MALQYMDGFDKYTAAADLQDRGFTVNPANVSYQAAGGYTGAGAIRVSGDNLNDFVLPINVAAGGELHFALWLKISGTATGAFFVINDEIEIGLVAPGPRLSMSAQVQVDSVQGTSTDYPADTYIHVEFAMKFADAGGFLKAWRNGAADINFSGDTVFTTQEALTTLAFKCGDADYIEIDDLVVWDATGTVFNPAQLNMHKIETLSPNAPGASTGFTSASGINWDNVNDAGRHDGDTTFNETTAAGSTDLYEASNLSSTPQTVHGVQVTTVAKDTGGVGAAIRNVIHSDATSEESGDRMLTTDFEYFSDFFPLDPDGDVAWTGAAVDAVQIGVKKQS